MQLLLKHSWSSYFTSVQECYWAPSYCVSVLSVVFQYYDKTLETEAQLWSETCTFDHDTNYQRFVPGTHRDICLNMRVILFSSAQLCVCRLW